MNALGGECLKDFERLREDAGLAEVLGHELPRPEAGRKLLYASDKDERTGQAPVGLLACQVSNIPSEGEPLHAVAQVNQRLVQAIGRQCTDQKTATADLSATPIESFKREAKPTSEGGKGYQPRLALWVEMDLALPDEFRDGNVPAHVEPLPMTRRPSRRCLGACGSILFAGTWPAGIGSW